MLEPGFRALVIDDDDFSRVTAVRIVRRLGAGEVIEARDCADALRSAQSLGNTIDLVLCDLRMPQVDGIETLAAVATHSPSARFVLASSADPRLLRAAADAAKRAGLTVLDVMSKPLTLAKVQDAAHALAKLRTEVGVRRIEIVDTHHYNAHEVAQGLTNREFTAFYQPKIDIRTRRVVGAEALIRWRHPMHGLVLPGKFLGVATQAKLLEAMFLVVLPTAAAHCATWIATGYEGGVSINLPTAIIGSRDLPNQLESFVREFGLDASRITFEVTEDGWLRDQDLAREVLTRLRVRGFGLSIDDFGTGYSGVQQLLNAPFNEIKIDQAFVRSAPTDKEAAIALDSIVALGRQLDLSIIAEGVETQAQWDHVENAGCDQVQGFLISQPQPPNEFASWLLDYTRQRERDAHLAQTTPPSLAAAS